MSIGSGRRDLERDSRQDSGFTLVELMIVVTILGILIAVGIPTFLGARDRASDTAAKARASQALKSQRVAASDAAQQFKTADELQAEDPNLTALPLPAGSSPSVLGVVYVRDPSGQVVTLVTKSATGKCFWTRASADGRTEYAVDGCGESIPEESWKSGW